MNESCHTYECVTSHMKDSSLMNDSDYTFKCVTSHMQVCAAGVQGVSRKKTAGHQRYVCVVVCVVGCWSVCCRVLECTVLCYRMLQLAIRDFCKKSNAYHDNTQVCMCCSVLHCAAKCCSVLQCVTMCCTTCCDVFLIKMVHAIYVL